MAFVVAFVLLAGVAVSAPKPKEEPPAPEALPSSLEARRKLEAAAMSAEAREQIRLLKEALRLDPASVDLHVFLSCVHLARSNEKEATGAAEDALALWDESYEAWNNLGLARLRRAMEGGAHARGYREATQKAREALTRASGIRPQSARARWNLGAALFQSGDVDGAIIELNLSLALWRQVGNVVPPAEEGAAGRFVRELPALCAGRAAPSAEDAAWVVPELTASDAALKALRGRFAALAAFPAEAKPDPVRPEALSGWLDGAVGPARHAEVLAHIAALARLGQGSALEASLGAARDAAWLRQATAPADAHRQAVRATLGDLAHAAARWGVAEAAAEHLLACDGTYGGAEVPHGLPSPEGTQ